MLKPLPLQAWATTTARQFTTSATTSTVLRGASSSAASSSSSLPQPLRALTIPNLARPYSTDNPFEPPPNPWKEWIRPNKRAQARYLLYGDLWRASQNGKEKGIEDTLIIQREKSRGYLEKKLGDRYNEVVEETKKEAYERYATKAWLDDIERTKQEVIARDENRRALGILDIEMSETKSQG